MRNAFKSTDTGLESVALSLLASEVARRADAAGKRNGPGDLVRAAGLAIAANLLRRECGLPEWLFDFERIDLESARLPPGRMRVVDRGPHTVRWHDVDTGERGFTARDAWDAALQAEMIRIAEDDDSATNT